jgi:hypothetical protein
MKLTVIAAVMIRQPKARCYLTRNQFLIVLLPKNRYSVGIDRYFQSRVAAEKLLTVEETDHSTTDHSNLHVFSLKVSLSESYSLHCAAGRQ